MPLGGSRQWLDPLSGGIARQHDLAMMCVRHRRCRQSGLTSASLCRRTIQRSPPISSSSGAMKIDSPDLQGWVVPGSPSALLRYCSSPSRYCQKSIAQSQI